MANTNSLLLKLEFFWWVITTIFATAVVIPILINVPSFPYLWLNVLMAVCFVFFTRHIFFLKYTFIAKMQYVKIALFFISIPVVFLLVSEVNFLQAYLNDGVLFSDLEALPFEEQLSIEKYIRIEILLIGTAAVISGILFAIRMLISVWRFRNRGTI